MSLHNTNFSLFKVSKYTYHKTKKTFQEARQHCLSNGADLVSITSPEDCDKIVGSKYDGDGWWIGMKRSDGDFSWMNGNDVRSKFWAGGFPHDGDDCAVVFGSEGWRSSGCNQRWYYICEYQGIHLLSCLQMKASFDVHYLIPIKFAPL